MFGSVKRALLAGLLLTLALSATIISIHAAEPVPVTVIDFEFYDTSLEGEVKGTNPEEQARLKLISNQLRELLGASDRYTIVDTAPAAAEIAAGGNWQSCPGCDTKIAKALGAKLSITGQVQKVSNLILNINIYIRDADTGDVVKVAGVDIRGNTDKSWQRGVSWLVRNRLLKK